MRSITQSKLHPTVVSVSVRVPSGTEPWSSASGNESTNIFFPSDLIFEYHTSSSRYVIHVVKLRWYPWANLFTLYSVCYPDSFFWYFITSKVCKIVKGCSCQFSTFIEELIGIAAICCSEENAQPKTCRHTLPQRWYNMASVNSTAGNSNSSNGVNPAIGAVAVAVSIIAVVCLVFV